MSKIRILIADDHAIVREGLRTLISSEPEMEVVGEAVNGNEAIIKAKELNPDVILMDLVMPVKSGLDAILEIKSDLPEMRILVLTSFSGDENIIPAIKAGALGYLLKDVLPRELLSAIKTVSQGEPSLEASVALKLLKEIRETSKSSSAEVVLTEREVDVIKLVAQGLSNQEIANQLCLSEWTVRSHVSDILLKLKLPNRTQAALYALRAGLVKL